MRPKLWHSLKLHMTSVLCQLNTPFKSLSDNNYIIIQKKDYFLNKQTTKINFTLELFFIKAINLHGEKKLLY